MSPSVLIPGNASEPGNESIKSEGLGEAGATFGTGASGRNGEDRDGRIGGWLRFLGGGGGGGGRRRSSGRCGRRRGVAATVITAVATPAAAACAGRVEGWPGDGVAGDGRIRVEKDAGIVGRVELGSEDALRIVGARASDLDVHALGVVLRAIGRLSSVESDDLMAEDVLTRGQGRGNRGAPCIIVLNQSNSSPLLRGGVIPSLVDLDPLERGLVGLGAVPAAVGNVGEDRTNVRLGPVRPLELDGAAGGNGGRDVSRSGVLVTVDVGRAVLVGRDESIVEVFSVPAGSVGDGLFVDFGVVVVEEEAAVVPAVGDEAGHGSVGEGSGGEGAEEEELGSE